MWIVWKIFSRLIAHSCCILSFTIWSRTWTSSPLRYCSASVHHRPHFPHRCSLLSLFALHPKPPSDVMGMRLQKVSEKKTGTDVFFKTEFGEGFGLRMIGSTTLQCSFFAMWTGCAAWSVWNHRWWERSQVPCLRRKQALLSRREEVLYFFEGRILKAKWRLENITEVWLIPCFFFFKAFFLSFLFNSKSLSLSPKCKLNLHEVGEMKKI